MSAAETTNARMQAALDLAAQGLPVFPCNAKKEPLVRRCFHAATRDTDVIRAWFERWPDALIGVPTGEASGIDVVDTDPRNGCGTWFEDNSHHVPVTRIHTTRGGGKHILFRHAPGLGCSNDTRIHAGVDVKADGGYIIWHPASGCEMWLDWELDYLAEWPDWLLPLARAGQPADRSAKGASVPLADRLPPSGDAVVALLDRMPNPLDADRGVYTTVMPAAQGCIDALNEDGTLGDDDESRIGDAAVAWAERWEGRSRDNETDEREKWERDWSTRHEPLAGWQTLENVACVLIPGYRLEQAQAEFATADTQQRDALLRALDIHAWADLEIPPKTRLLGDLVATGTRGFLVGSTGLGKTHLAHAMAVGIATGTGFLHWKCDRPGRVLVIDGEMSKRLLKKRLAAAIQRSTCPIPAGNLIIYSLDRCEEFASAGLGDFEPLNTPAGHTFVKRLVGIVAPDVIIFDNVMSLIAGDQKDELPWADTKQTVLWLTRQGIAQLWLDHTGHDRTRQYGSSTKAWKFDTVGVMTAVDGEQKPGETTFRLSFKPVAGKARERDAENWSDFACRTITLSGDTWGSKLVGPDEPAKPVALKIKPAATKWYDALVEALRTTPGTITRGAWFAMGVRRGLTEAIAEDDTKTVREAKRGSFRNAQSDLVASGWIAVDGETVRDLRDGGALADLV